MNEIASRASSSSAPLRPLTPRTAMSVARSSANRSRTRTWQMTWLYDSPVFREMNSASRLFNRAHSGDMPPVVVKTRGVKRSFLHIQNAIDKLSLLFTLALLVGIFIVAFGCYRPKTLKFDLKWTKFCYSMTKNSPYQNFPGI